MWNVYSAYSFDTEENSDVFKKMKKKIKKKIHVFPVQFEE